MLPGVVPSAQAVYARRLIRRVRFSTVDPDQRKKLLELAAEGFQMEPDRMAANTMVVDFPTTDTLVAELESWGMDAGRLVESQDELTLTDCLRLQAFYQGVYVDNAISYTINVPAEPHQLSALADGADTPPAPTPERVNAVAAELAGWLPQLKGVTVFIDGSRPQAPLERLTDDQWAELTTPKVVGDSFDEECATGACPIK